MELNAITRNDARWKDIYDFIAACGNAQSPRSLVVEMFNNLGTLCPFDQALAYFFDGNGKVCGQHLINISERWSSAYLGYYVGAGSHNYSCYADPDSDDRFATAPAMIRSVAPRVRYRITAALHGTPMAMARKMRMRRLLRWLSMTSSFRAAVQLRPP